MKAIEAAGGMITHEYKLIKWEVQKLPYYSILISLNRGFAATAPAKILESVQAWGNEYNAVIEEDQIVQIVWT
jgi:hypothetical protein